MYPAPFQIPRCPRAEIPLTSAVPHLAVGVCMPSQRAQEGLPKPCGDRSGQERRSVSLRPPRAVSCPCHLSTSGCGHARVQRRSVPGCTARGAGMRGGNVGCEDVGACE